MTLNDFLIKIDYQFNNSALLEEALTHPSNSGKQNKNKKYNYQRLEFLGDSVLAMVIAELLMKNFPDENEGQLSKRHSYLVSGKTLASIARKIDISKFMYLSRGEEEMGGRNNDNNLENTVEALIGAIYLDSDLSSCQKFIKKYWQEIIENGLSPFEDPVSHLQELIQAKGKLLPQYQIIKIRGSEHRPVFTATVTFDQNSYSAEGFSKKEAQKNVAHLALEAMKGIGD